jgi:hypothetical protein
VGSDRKKEGRKEGKEDAAIVPFLGFTYILYV